MMYILFIIVVIVLSIKWYNYLKNRLLKFYANWRYSEAIGLQILIRNLEDMVLTLNKPQVILDEEAIKNGYFENARPEKAFGHNDITILFGFEDTIERNRRTAELICAECNKMLLGLSKNSYGLERYVDRINAIQSDVMSIKYTYVNVYNNTVKPVELVASYSLEDIRRSIDIYKIRLCSEEEE